MSPCTRISSLNSSSEHIYSCRLSRTNERRSERASERADGGRGESIFGIALPLCGNDVEISIDGRATNRASLRERISFREDSLSLSLRRPAACILAHVRENIAIFGLSGVPWRRLTSAGKRAATESAGASGRKAGEGSGKEITGFGTLSAKQSHPPSRTHWHSLNFKIK